MIQIVAVLPPAVSGVGDYALCVARALFDKWGIQTQFVVCDPTWVGPQEIDSFPVIRIDARDPSILSDALTSITQPSMATRSPGEKTVILLQLSSYGYDRNGCPFWLAQGLRDWKRGAAPGVRILITMFHELYAMSFPWRKAFWVSAFQRKVLKDIHMLTDLTMTNMSRYAGYLDRGGSGGMKACVVLNTPSTVGETEHFARVCTRERRLAIFGSMRSRRDIYGRAGEAIAGFVRSYGIEEIVDIGTPLSGKAVRGLGCPVRTTGVLPAENVRKELAGCVAGILWYPPAYFGKSSIYAAYCAHGLAPLVAGSWKGSEYSDDGIEEGRHFIYLDRVQSLCNWPLIETVSKEAHSRYANHDISHHAARVALLLSAANRLGDD